MRRFPWMVDVIMQRPVSNPHPYMVEVYVARDGSEAMSLPHLVEGVLRPKRLGEGGAVGTGI